MKSTLTLTVIVIVVFLFYVGLKFSELSKRRQEKNAKDPTKLKPRKIGVKFNITPKDINTSIIQMVETMKARGGRVAYQEERTAIVYLGEASISKFNGMLNTPADEMPIRVVITSQNYDSSIDVSMDEDYGFQMFAGRVQKAFREKYNQAFDFYKRLLNGCVQ